MLGALSEDYVRTARAKGAPERRVLVNHALRNALLPIVTIFGLDLGTAARRRDPDRVHLRHPRASGRLTVEAARSFDIPLIAGVVLFAALLIVIANIVVDLLYAVIDPRIRLA